MSRSVMSWPPICKMRTNCGIPLRCNTNEVTEAPTSMMASIRASNPIGSALHSDRRTANGVRSTSVTRSPASSTASMAVMTGASAAATSRPRDIALPSASCNVSKETKSMTASSTGNGI